MDETFSVKHRSGIDPSTESIAEQSPDLRSFYVKVIWSI